MTDSIIFTLSRIRSLRVMPRASVSRFKNESVSPVEAGRALCSKGDWREGIPAIRRAIELGSGKSSEAIGYLGVAFAKSGNRAKAREQIRILSEGLDTNPTLAYPIAKVHAALGDREEALGWLERARDAQSWHLVEIRIEPAFDSIRDDPRFEALVQVVAGASEQSR